MLRSADNHFHTEREIAMKTLFTAVLTLLSLFATVTIAAERIRLTNGEWPPYLSEHLPHFGSASHIVEEAFAAVGIEVEYFFSPWKRSYLLAKEGEWDGTLVWVKTPEREQSFYYSDIVITDSEYLFHLKSRELDWRTIEDLKGLTVGATLHTVYPTLEKGAANGLFRIERAGNYDNLYRRLLRKRIDVIPQVLEVGKYYQRTTLSSEERDRITFAKTVIQQRQYHLILSKKREANKHRIELFNEGLSRLRATGRYEEILKAMGRGEYDQSLPQTVFPSNTTTDDM
jgi:polar amino acid transport system substrate-binding protein